MKPYPLCIILLFVSGMAVGQSQPDDTGIYLTIKCSKSIPRQNIVLTGRSVCLAPSPIIVPADFESVGDVVNNNNVVYFELTFRRKAKERLAMLTANLPGSKLALVVDSEVFFVFGADELKVMTTFRFQGDSEHLAAFNRVHDSLRASLVPN
jgi:hypothetical protein